jgi:hypothetical protein
VSGDIYSFPESGHPEICDERQKTIYSVEKLQNFLGAKFICDVTISKI